MVNRSSEFLSSSLARAFFLDIWCLDFWFLSATVFSIGGHTDLDIFVAWASEKIVRKILLLSGLSLFISLFSLFFLFFVWWRPGFSFLCFLGPPRGAAASSRMARCFLPPFPSLSLPGSVAVSLSLSLFFFSLSPSFFFFSLSLSLYVSFPCVHSASSQPVVTVSTWETLCFDSEYELWTHGLSIP